VNSPLLILHAALMPSPSPPLSQAKQVDIPEFTKCNEPPPLFLPQT